MESDHFVDNLPWVNPNARFFEINPQDEYNLSAGEKTASEDEIIPQTAVLPEKLASRIISLSRSYPEIDYLLEKDGVGCISSGDIIVLKGKAKAGKTTAMLCLVTALLKGRYVGFTAIKQYAKVMFIDTEQNPLNTAIFVKKVHALCGYSDSEDHPQFQAFNLRADPPAERCRVISEAVKFFTPDLLVIDGAKDLIDGSDINDPKASGQTIQFLMSLTRDFNLALLTTLHENKGDSNLRGHVGTELLNKCSECWQVRKYDEIFETEQTECRNQSAGGFSFTFDEDKLPVHTVHITRKSAALSPEQRMREIFAQCLLPGTSLRYTDLKSRYMALASCSDTSAEKHISKALKLQYLFKDENGIYSFNHS